jgi:multidrug efflux pump subunit AcrA (membrane-fusion protein)
MTTPTTAITAESLTCNAPVAPTHAQQRIVDLVAECRSVTAFYRGAFDITCQHFGAIYGAMNLSNAVESLDEQWTAGDGSQNAWQRITEASNLESETSGVALARLYDIDRTDVRVAVLSVPIRDDRSYTGAVAIVVHCTDRKAAESALFELRSLSLLTCSLASSVQVTREPGPAGLDNELRAIAKAARFTSLTEMAFAITNGLKTKFQCDQVILGKVDGGRVRIVSMSSFDALYPRSPGSRLVRQAMEECLDSGHLVISTPRRDWSEPASARDYRLHRQWRSSIGDSAVASVPLFCANSCVAVLSLVRPGSVGFQSGELEEIEQIAGAYGPAIQLVARASRSWLTQTRDSLRNGFQWLFARSHWGRKIVVTGVVLLATWFCLGTVNYHISMPCQVIPTRVQHFGSPFEGVLDSAHVEAGDEVKQGQLLFAMDTRELELQQRELESEAAVAELEISHSVAQQQIEAAAVARARLGVVRARLASVAQRIALSEVRAPADGTIMAADAMSLVGDVVPLGKSLLEFAPHGDWAVELRVDGRNGTLVRDGQCGQFVTVASPDQPVRCTVDRVQPSATVVDGKHVFVARARLSGNATWNLVGMDGVATLEVGPRRVCWVALHRVIDFVRLHFWV